MVWFLLLRKEPKVPGSVIISKAWEGARLAGSPGLRPAPCHPSCLLRPELQDGQGRTGADRAGWARHSHSSLSSEREG